jgi:hypothetical protein
MKMKQEEMETMPNNEAVAEPCHSNQVVSVDPERSDSIEEMIKDWKDKIRKEKEAEIEEELAEIFAVIDKLAATNVDQVCAVYEETDISMDDKNFNGTFVEECDDQGAEVCDECDDEECNEDCDDDSNEERDYKYVEIPDEALSAYLDHSNLSNEERKILYENDKGMLTWIKYQLCEEILLGGPMLLL